MCGVSGSGKTHYSRELEKNGFVRLSADEFVWSKYGQDFKKFSFERQKQIQSDIIEEILCISLRYLEEGKPVVIDSTMCKRVRRQHFAEVCHNSFGITPLILYFDVPISILRNRLSARLGSGPNDQIISDERLKTFVENFEKPQPNENYITVSRYCD